MHATAIAGLVVLGAATVALFEVQRKQVLTPRWRRLGRLFNDRIGFSRCTMSSRTYRAFTPTAVATSGLR